MVNDPNTLAAQAAEGVGFAPKRKPRIAWEIARLGSDFKMVSGLIKHGCPGLFPVSFKRSDDACQGQIKLATGG